MNKDFKYILKRVLIGVLVGFILFSLKSCNVKAYTNEIISNDVEFPTGNATFLSMNDNYRFTNVGFRYFYGSTLNPTLYFATPTTNNLVCGNYGCGINIDGLSVVKDSYYSITIFLMGSNSPFWHYSYSALTNKVGVSNGFSSINSDYFVAPTSGTTSTSRSCNSIYDNEYTGNCLFQWTILFKAPRNGTSVQTWWSSNPRGADPQDNGLFVGYNFKYVGDSSLSPEQLNTALNNVTSSINNNINTATQNIITNQNNNTSAILGSITDLWHNIINNDEICFDYNIRINRENKEHYTIGYLKSDGTIGTQDGYVISNFIHLNTNTNYSLITSNYVANSPSYCIYNSSKELSACYSYNNSSSFNIHVNSDSYIRFSARIDGNNYTTFTGKYCGTGNQILYDSQNQNSQNINDSINQVNDTLTDETPPNLSGLSNSAGWLPAGPVDSILNLPLSLLNNLSSNLSNQCQPVVLPVPFVDSEITLPCMMTIYEQIGITTWVNLVGTIASAFILLSYLIKLYKWVDDTLTFRENNYIDNWGGI